MCIYSRCKDTERRCQDWKIYCVQEYCRLSKSVQHDKRSWTLGPGCQWICSRTIHHNWKHCQNWSLAYDIWNRYNIIKINYWSFDIRINYIYRKTQMSRRVCGKNWELFILRQLTKTFQDEDTTRLFQTNNWTSWRHDDWTKAFPYWICIEMITK